MRKFEGYSIRFLLLANGYSNICVDKRMSGRSLCLAYTKRKKGSKGLFILSDLMGYREMA